MRLSDRPEDYHDRFIGSFEQTVRRPDVLKRDQEMVRNYNDSLQAKYADVISAVVEAFDKKEKELDFHLRLHQWNTVFPYTCLQAYKIEDKTCIPVEAVMDSHSHTGTGYFCQGSLQCRVLNTTLVDALMVCCADFSIVGMSCTCAHPL